MTNFTVTNTDDSGAGSLRQAILDANNTPSDDVINFSTQLLGQTITLTSGQLLVTDDLRIEGPGDYNLTVSGNNASRVFLVSDGNDNNFINVAISGLTVTQGNNTATLGKGAGIWNEESLTVTDSTISNNISTGLGAGIYNQRGSLKLLRSTVSDNKIDNFPDTGGQFTGGGGIFNLSGASLEVDGSTISGNKSNRGGGIWNQGNLKIVNSTISGNQSSEAGGGILSNSSNQTTEINFSTIVNNESNIVAIDRGSGGGIAVNGGTATISNTIIAGNTNRIVTASTNPDVEGNFTSNGHNLIGDLKGSTGFDASEDLDDIEVSQHLVFEPALSDNGGSTLTHALTTVSPAIDTADPNGSITIDQRGISRPQGDGFDIGAFEIEQQRYDSITVNSVGDLIPDFTVDLDHVTLREAIEFTRAGGTIEFDPSLAGKTIDLLQGQLVIDKDLTIKGLGADQLTVQAFEDEPARVFLVDDGDNSNALDVNIQGLTLDAELPDPLEADYPDIGGILNRENLKISDSTIQNGNADRGGAIFNELGRLTLTNSTISNNDADVQGGGIVNLAFLSVERSTFRNNFGDFGGGIHNEGEVTIKNSLFDRNEATDGAGINNQGTMSIFDTTISNNGITSSPSFGGGIRNIGDLYIADSTISGNVVDEGKGGGIFNTGSLDIVNSTISGNSFKSGFKDDAGGGIFNGGTLTVTNSTITNNIAPQGGGIVSMSSSSVTINNTIVAGNFDSNNSEGINPDVFGEFTTTRYNLIGDGTGSTGFTNGVDGNQVGNSTNPIDPKLGLLQDNGGFTETHALLPESPAIDAADSNGILVDQRGVSRPQGNGFDIGAFELETVPNNGTIFGTSGDNYLVGTLNADTIDGLAGNDEIRGSRNQDLLIGGDGNDLLSGQSGDDTLLGGNHNDKLYGEAGDDVLEGGAGNDSLNGWKGNDLVSGGAGNDVFVLEATYGTDTFVDFVVGEDLIRMKDGLDFSDLSITQSDGNTLIAYNSDTLAILNGVTQSLTAASFV